MKTLLLLLLLFPALYAQGQSLENTTWKVYNSGFLTGYYKFTADSLLHSPNNTIYTTESAYWTNDTLITILDNPMNLCTDTGTYLFHFTGDTLHFTTIEEECFFREGVLTGMLWVSVDPLAVMKIKEAALPRLFPNPASQQISMHTPGSTHYFLYNSLGQQLRSGPIVDAQTIIDIHLLPAGHYFIRTDSKQIPALHFQKR